MQKTDPARVVRAARLYASNTEASKALGIALGSFGRLCKQHCIETPYDRRRRRAAGRSRRQHPPGARESTSSALSGSSRQGRYQLLIHD